MAMTLTEVAYEELLNMFSIIHVPHIQSKRFICYLNAFSLKSIQSFHPNVNNMECLADIHIPYMDYPHRCNSHNVCQYFQSHTMHSCDSLLSGY
jgi:hypothetical protein